MYCNPICDIMKRTGVLLSILALVAVACTSVEEASFESISMPQRVVAPLSSAYCTAVVTINGVDTQKNMETDYLPHVLACENFSAQYEALKALAIAARSTAYYYMAQDGRICDGQACQVYSCSASPQTRHYQAAAATAGQYLNYSDTLTYGFYVAGDPSTPSPSCVSSSSSGTEYYVTYNQGKTGTNVEQTTLGWVHSPSDFGYGQNRGCLSQNGSICLENQGYSYMNILRFYYGADIYVSTAPGSCSGTQQPPPKVTGLSPDGWGNVGSSGVSLGWNAATGATNYDVLFWYWDWNSASWKEYYTWNTTGTSLSVWPVYHDTYYAWTVKAKNNAGTGTQADYAYFYLD
ncbi:MAG: SpoIID/LytB domain-containing protein [Deltaproteobacteria bacterium]|nr:SpoIID/LytB domain-containing protein [Deltaproteobacteria bacterium]